MRTKFASVLILVFTFVVVGVASQALAAPTATPTPKPIPGCKSVLPLTTNVYKQSKPHRACTQIDCPIDYFEKFPSLLVNTKNIPSAFSATLIDIKGNSLATCGKLDCRDCKQGFRYVCRGSTNSFARTAHSRTKSYTVYYKVNKTCVKIPDIGKCVGSVKGPCNQTLH